MYVIAKLIFFDSLFLEKQALFLWWWIGAGGPGRDHWWWIGAGGPGRDRWWWMPGNRWAIAGGG